MASHNFVGEFLDIKKGHNDWMNSDYSGVTVTSSDWGPDITPSPPIQSDCVLILSRVGD